MKEGGVLDHQLHTLDIQCQPADLPSHVELDVTDLGLGEAAKIKDINFPNGVEAVLDGEVVVALVSEPRVSSDEEDEAAAAAGAATEPERVGESSDDSEEAASE